MLRQTESRQLGGMEVCVYPTADSDWLQVIPSDIAPRDVLKTRQKGLTLLRKYTSDVDGFRVPRYRRRRESKFEVEKAEGVCLQSTGREENSDREFYAISTEQKLEALKIYLEAVKALNDNGEMVHDHNPDGVFIDVSGEDVQVWLVDPADIGKGLHREDIEDGIHGEREVSVGGVGELLSAFFHRKEEAKCVPYSVRQVCEEIRDKKKVSVSDLIEVVGSVNQLEIEEAESYRERLYAFSSHEEWLKKRGRRVINFVDKMIEGEPDEATRALEGIVIEAREYADILEPYAREEIEFWFDLVFNAVNKNILLAGGFNPPDSKKEIEQQSDYSEVPPIKDIKSFYLELNSLLLTVDRGDWFIAIRNLISITRV